ncbi:hypothetical protein XI06_24915 [Bradyrhizobium sp. CCBAU 11434]|nr:hypothetical protein [Bradyrhizobium sp. CCBAU 11434]
MAAALPVEMRADCLRAFMEKSHAIRISPLDASALLRCDDLAQRGEEGAVEIAPSLRVPPWQ